MLANGLNAINKMNIISAEQNTVYMLASNGWKGWKLDSARY